MIKDLLLLVVGFVLLYYGAEGLVKGSVCFAARLGVSAMVIGLTVVAYGTSMPELVVSVKTAWSGQGDIAVGNIVGSNIFNIAVILGLAALLNPIKVKRQLVRVDVPIMIGVAALLMVLFQDRHLGRLEGLIFLIGAAAYTWFNFAVSRKTGEAGEVADGEAKPLPSVWAELGLILIGFVLLILGAKYLVDGGVNIARRFNVSEAVIGLTIISAGTGLPELATSVVAAIRKEADIAIGNVVGSNIFNILGILGAASFIHPIKGGGITSIDMWVMMGVSLALLPFLRTGFRLSRAEGGAFLASYGVYLGYLLWKH